jgi:hypothetical protein
LPARLLIKAAVMAECQAWAATEAVIVVAVAQVVAAAASVVLRRTKLTA